MPGANCSVVDCGTSRREKGIGIFKLPEAINEQYTEWRRDWLDIITRTRVVDADLKRQIQEDKIYTCEKHFNKEDIDICKYSHYPCYLILCC